MKKQLTFERFETKYILTSEQYHNLKAFEGQYLIPDVYPTSRIATVYYDTDDYRIIRASIEAKDFKEKLRLRKYVSSETHADTFLEIKRKCEGVVYKRRHTCDVKSPQSLVFEENLGDTQIEREIAYLFNINPTLGPKSFIAYDRESFVGAQDSSFRITLDTNIIARFDKLENAFDQTGDSILETGMYLMEVKSRFGYPEWFLSYLSSCKVMKQSFSKYGNAYRKKYLEGAIQYV